MTTRKAYAAAAVSALGAILAAIAPGLNGTAATIVYAVLAALVALGVTWRVPNGSRLAVVDLEHGQLTAPVELVAAAAAQLGGATGPVELVEPGRVTAVLDTVPGLVAAPLTTLDGLLGGKGDHRLDEDTQEDAAH